MHTVVEKLFASASSHAEPYHHLHFAGPSDGPSDRPLGGSGPVTELAGSYPNSILVPSERTFGSDKSYTVNTLTVIADSIPLPAFESLPLNWRNLISELASSPALEKLCGELGVRSGDLRTVEARLASYPAGGWMSRHTDGPDKLFSWIIYFNPAASTPVTGGAISFFDSAGSTVPACSVSPGAMNGVAFARSATSWHEVAPVDAQTRSPRQSLLIHGYR